MIKSPLLTVGGLLHVSVALPSVPAEIRVIAITSRIIQNLSIQLPSDPERSIVPPHEVLSLLTLNGDSPRKPSSASACVAEPDILYTISARPHDATLLALVPSGESFALECFTRLPTDGVLRPSTIQRHTKPPIRISHEIRFEVLYQTPTSKVRVARLSQPISFITVRSFLVLQSTALSPTLTIVSSAASARACCFRSTAGRTIRSWAQLLTVLDRQSRARCSTVFASEAWLSFLATTGTLRPRWLRLQ